MFTEHTLLYKLIFEYLERSVYSEVVRCSLATYCEQSIARTRHGPETSTVVTLGGMQLC